ncbi:DUF3883 domain-containing protein [Halalkalibacter alkaliphilus]|uniref:DUF3883 domain-containing protein n=1 Tax=Halalkalibacter alkaliphilus TaxID=2917993 RepID=A0A9X2I3L1_9BACI|nr:DUF3883 domain-containing protein [Halalkalibacter alkaliphilus]MCL7747322.1 DUF3883 domain-containing protein [Halalkalibacter alkaliphilus]
MNLYVSEFLKKLKDEAPAELDVIIGQSKFDFKSVSLTSVQGSLLRYKANYNNNEIVLEVRHVHNHSTFNRLEIHSPGKSAQITCFHFGTTGLMYGQEIVEINQIVKFSGQAGSESNTSKKEAVCEVFEREGLLVQEDRKAPKWHIGTFNNQEKEWLYGQNSIGFLRNFLKVALIMAHFRGDRGIILNFGNESEEINSPDQYLDQVDVESLYPEKDNLKVIDPVIFSKYRDLCEEIGAEGEVFVYFYEKERLEAAGRLDLASKIKHVSKENCAAGYDILSYSEDGRYKYIECKATKGASTLFEISSNEWEKAKHLREQYYIYRINYALDSPRVTIIKDPYKLFESNEASIIPTAYKFKLTN